MNGCPAVTMPPIGKIREAGARRATGPPRPSRNDGIEIPRKATPVRAKSSFEYWRSAERIPSGMPTKMPMSERGPHQRRRDASSPRMTVSRTGSPPTCELVAEVALQGLGEPADVADRERLVEAVPRDDDPAHRLVAGELRPDERRHRVARREREEEEDEDRDPEARSGWRSGAGG